jgi:uncharacterized membrane protein YfcA
VQTFLIYLAAGAAAGMMAGLLGVGGGIIIVPVLVFLFTLHGMAPDVITHLAIGTSLATIVVTSLSSIRAHQRRGVIMWPVFLRITPGIVLGALLGAVVADALSSDTLRRVFGAFAVTVALQMGLAGRPAAHRELPGTAGLLAVGTCIGGISSLVGIGGGSLSVPFMSFCNVAMRTAVATSAAIGLPIAIAGAAGFVVTGWGHPGLPAWATGYVYWPGFLGIVLASALVAPLGARLAHSLPTHTLQRIFALFLAVVGLKMLIG